MMNPEKECPRCLLMQSGGEKELEEIKRCIERIKPEEKAGDDEYQKRLSICGECEFLISGTCIKCGCYVELRAAYKKNCCPLAGSKRRWFAK